MGALSWLLNLDFAGGTAVAEAVVVHPAIRIPNPHSPVEVRQFTQQLAYRSDVITTGTSGYVLVGQGSGIAPVWGTELTSLTKITVDNITIDAAFIKSSSGAIDFDDENLTTTGTVSGINITSGANPGHTHTGASLTIDHGDDLAGLGDDDHTIYSLADGTRAFSGVVSGVTPTVSTHLAIKEYVDQNVQFTFEYYFNDDVSDIGGTYRDMTDTATGEGESSFSTASLGVADDQALYNWATVSGVPGVLKVKKGIYSAHFTAARTAGDRDAQIYFKVYRYETDTTETLLATSATTGNVTSKASFDLYASVFTDVVILTADRIIYKFFVNVSGGSSDDTIILYAEGSTTARVSFPTNTEVLSSIYIRQDGTKDLTGNLSVDAGITIDGRDISVDGTALDTAVSLQHTQGTDTALGTQAETLDMGTNLISNVTDPASAQDAATRAYVDASATADVKVGVDSGATADYLGAAGGDGVLRVSSPVTYSDGGNFVTIGVDETSINHDNLNGFVSNEHVDHSTVSITGFGGLTGGGTIGVNQTISLSHLGIESLADPNADRIMFWDDSETAMKWLTVGSGLTLSGTTLTGYSNTAAKVYMDTNQTLTSGVFTVLEFDDTAWDLGSNLDEGNFRYNVPETGYYLVTFSVYIETIADGAAVVTYAFKGADELDSSARLCYNLTRHGAAGSVVPVGFAVAYLTAGEYIRVAMVHYHGSNRDVGNFHWGTFMFVMRVA